MRRNLLQPHNLNRSPEEPSGANLRPTRAHQEVVVQVEQSTISEERTVKTEDNNINSKNIKIIVKVKKKTGTY